MSTRHLITAGVLLAATLLITPDAEARRGKRSFRSRGHYSKPIWPRSRYRSAVTYSGVSRAEQDYWRRRDAWYDYAFGGFRPGDFF